MLKTYQPRQRGVSILGILFICVGIVLVAVLTLKITPAYMEYGTVKKALQAAKDSGGKTVLDLQKAFQRNADINGITVIYSKDLDITKEGNDIVMGFHYDKKIPLFANVSILIEFQASTRDM
ncbi:MAG TPA: DUF4845 domain-containing protein [Burkholderiales bacterium]|jgi:hypothetical protein